MPKVARAVHAQPLWRRLPDSSCCVEAVQATGCVSFCYQKLSEVVKFSLTRASTKQIFASQKRRNFIVIVY